jgi:hypothetical protein
LPSEKVTKRDIYHLFHKYGRLAQIAIKSAYGFVQFHDSAACRAALHNEEGSEVRGRKIRKCNIAIDFGMTGITSDIAQIWKFRSNKRIPETLNPTTMLQYKDLALQIMANQI